MLIIITLIIILYLIGLGILLTQSLPFNFKLFLWILSPLIVFIAIGCAIGIHLEPIDEP